MITAIAAGSSTEVRMGLSISADASGPVPIVCRGAEDPAAILLCDSVAWRAVKTFVAAVALCLALIGAGCGDDDSSTTGVSESTTTENTGSTDTSKKPKVEVPQGAPPKELVENDLVEGDGATAKKGDEVTVQYVGAVYKSGKEFDASWDRGEPFSFQLGGGGVIPGWEQGLEGMKAGGRRELIIPPNLAYGSAGAPPTIGPNETLVFVVDLVKVN
jgi:peptidylprolyl isomerase